MVAVDPAGRVYKLETTEKPFLTPDAVTNWSEKLARDSFTLNFVNYKGQLANLQSRFTTGAYKAFLDEMQKSGVMAQITTNRLVLSTSTEPAKIIGSSVLDGHYVWEIDVPMIIALNSAAEKTERTMKVVIKLMVQRVDMQLNPEYPILVKKYVSIIK